MANGNAAGAQGGVVVLHAGMIDSINASIA
jgi:hypothetical protein